MTQLNPIQFIQMIKNGQNPQQLMINFLEAEMKGTPMGENLLTLAKNNDSTGIEKVVRNIFAQRGIDFDKEFMAFKQQLLGLK